MKNKDDENIEKLVKKLVQTASVETPSPDFTKNVLMAILDAKTSKSLIYKPIISKTGWLFISVAVVGVFAFLIFQSASGSSASQSDFSFLRSGKLFDTFSGFQLSSMTVNILFLAFLMIFIQILLLKSYLDKRFQK